MKKTLLFLCLSLLLAVLFPLFLSAQETTYGLGDAEEGLLNGETAQKVKAAVSSAARRFGDWLYEGVPTGYVTEENGYYLQTFTDGEDRNAAVYVGQDFRSRVLRGPVYDQLLSVGGLERLGEPLTDSYEVDGTWYQNFRNGYVIVPQQTGKASFIAGKEVNEAGDEVEPVSDAPAPRISSPAPDPASSPRSVTEDVVRESVAPRWVTWLTLGVLAVAVGILAIACLARRKHS